MKKFIRPICLLAITVMVFAAMPAAFAVDNQEELFIELQDARIGVMTGSTGEAYAKANFPNARMESFADIMDAVAALSANKLDAVVTSDVSAMNIVKNNPSMKITSDILVVEPVSVVVDKGSGELLAQFNDIIETFEADGTLNDMVERWMLSDEPVIIDIPEADGPPIKVSVTATRAPFSYKNAEGKIIGFAPELAYRAGLILNRRVEFVVTDFAAMIPSVLSGKSDAIIDLLVYTEERAKSVDFSKPYYISGQVILQNTPIERAGFSFAALKERFMSTIVAEKGHKMLINGLLTTTWIALCAFILETLLGALLCYMSMSKHAPLNYISRAYSYIIRGTPMVVLLMITFYIIFAKSSMSASLVAVIAFGMSGASAMSVIFRTALGTVEKGQREAARSMGFSRIAEFFYIVLPQAARVAFPTYESEFVSLFKGTAIVGYIAIVDLTKAGDFIRARTFDPFFPLIIVAIMYILAITVIVCVFDLIFKSMDKRGRRKRLCSK